MQPVRQLINGLYMLATTDHCIFAPEDMRALVPELSDAAFRVLLSRASANGPLQRICRGIYVFEPVLPRDGLLLFRVAARLRADRFNYISLETSLSDAGVISQIPMNWITVMSSGRTSTINCGRHGNFIPDTPKLPRRRSPVHEKNTCGLQKIGSPACQSPDALSAARDNAHVAAPCRRPGHIRIFAAFAADQWNSVTVVQFFIAVWHSESRGGRRRRPTGSRRCDRTRGGRSRSS